MNRTQRTERKVLATLVTLIEKEQAQLSKIRILAWVTSMGGGLLFGLMLIPAIRAESQEQWFFGMGLVAGVLMGISVSFHASLAQWPVIRRFLDVGAIKREHEREP